MKRLFILVCVFMSTYLFANSSDGLILKEQLTPPVKECKQTLQKRSYIWIKGQWDIINNNYIWVDGHWESKRFGYVFIDGEWNKKSNGWIWKKGYWKKIDMNKWLNLYT
tara:strand:+ start:266 stop:592 length:327 start_codon:yes stop_codon:yes gene_type:complete